MLKIIVKIKFDNFFIYYDPELATKIPRPARSLESYVPPRNTAMPIGPISVNGLKNAFFSMW